MAIGDASYCRGQACLDWVCLDWTKIRYKRRGTPSQQDKLQEFDAAIFGYIIVYSAGNKIQLGLNWLMQTTMPNIVYFNLGKIWVNIENNLVLPIEIEYVLLSKNENLELIDLSNMSFTKLGTGYRT